MKNVEKDSRAKNDRHSCVLSLYKITKTLIPSHDHMSFINYPIPLTFNKKNEVNKKNKSRKRSQ